MRRQSVFLISLVFALLLVGGVWAQDSSLSYGTPVSGAISNSDFHQDWTLGTASADRISVRVERTTGNLIPDVSVLDSNGTALAQSYGSDYTYAAAEIEDFTLPSAGTYTIQVTRYNGQDGESKGEYSLEVTPLGTAEDNPNNQVVIGDVQLDTPIEGEITATHWRHVYTLTALSADYIDVVAERTGGTLNPLVTVLDANGSALSTGYNDDTIAETGNFQLPSAGEYQVVVSRESDQTGATLGNYELTVHLVGSGEGSPFLEGAAGVTAYDQPLTGSLTDAQWYQDWQLTATGGDIITLDVTRTDGDLQPEVILLGGSGQELYHGYGDATGAAAVINRTQLGGPGNYTVRVSRYSGQTGDTSGGYTLTVTLNGAGEDTPGLDEPVGEVALGTAAEGEITAANWQNVWTFTSDTDASINVKVKRTNGTLSPVLEIRDANGQSLNSAYASDTRDSAEISNYSLPGAGTYQIVVSRQDGASGYTSGGYTLTVSAGTQ